MNNQCPICINEISYISSRKLTCSHTFHTHCITKWFEIQKNKNTCPVCRMCIITSNIGHYYIRNVDIVSYQLHLRFLLLLFSIFEIIILLILLMYLI